MKYYTFNSADVSGTLLANTASTPAVYDASLSVIGLYNTNDYALGNGSLSFNGDITKYVTLPSLTTNSTGVSISLWVKGTTSPPGSCLFDIGNGETNNNIVASIGDNSNNLVIAIYNGLSLYSKTASQSILNGAWTHIAWTIAPSGWKLYINGIDTTFTGTTTYPNMVTRTLNFIGKRSFITTTGNNLIYNGSFNEYTLKSGESFSESSTNTNNYKFIFTYGGGGQVTVTNWWYNYNNDNQYGYTGGGYLGGPGAFGLGNNFPSSDPLATNENFKKRVFIIYGKSTTLPYVIRLPVDTYKLTWYMLKGVMDGSNVTITLTDASKVLEQTIATIDIANIPDSTVTDVWKQFTATFSISTEKNYIIIFNGPSSGANDQSCGLANVSLLKVTTSPLTAQIDDFRLFNSVLTNQDASAIYQQYIPLGISATGGTITEYYDSITGNKYKIHTFIEVGISTFTTVGITKIDYLVVGGGGAGGNSLGGGGGGGGFLNNTNLSITNGSYTITVGNGAVGMSSVTSAPTNLSGGSSSIIGGSVSITAIGGGSGFGQSYSNSNPTVTTSGSSAGGKTRNQTNANSHTSEGYAGGGYLENGNTWYYASGGGGGAGGVGFDYNNTNACGGGIGKLSSITGTATYYAGGGGGCYQSGLDGKKAATTAGGLGGGGSGLNNSTGGISQNGLSNTGGGGGGNANSNASNSNGYGKGGSGIVIIRYKV